MTLTARDRRCLAAWLRRITPRGPAEADELAQWVQRLEERR